jgi:fatty acid desaturase
MDAESTLPAVIPGDSSVVSGPTGRHTENALLGWILVVGLTLIGFLLLAVGSSVGGPGWPMYAFLALGLVGVVCYGLWVYPYFRDLERRIPDGQERWSKLESELVATFEQLGAGDLVRSIQHTQGLPEGLARISKAASARFSLQ